jgi:hypothetical protein
METILSSPTRPRIVSEEELEDISMFSSPDISINQTQEGNQEGNQEDAKYIPMYSSRTPTPFYHWKMIESQEYQPQTPLEYLLMKYPEKSWNWGRYCLSKNSAITPGIVEYFKEKPWDYRSDGLSSNSSITEQFILKHCDQFQECSKDGLSRNSAISLEFIQEHPEMKWFWGNYGISQNPRITPEFIVSNLEKDWDWGQLHGGGGDAARPAAGNPESGSQEEA